MADESRAMSAGKAEFIRKKLEEQEIAAAQKKATRVVQAVQIVDVQIPFGRVFSIVANVVFALALLSIIPAMLIAMIAAAGKALIQ